VQASLSLQEVPSVFAGFEQIPVPMSQVPALWHWSGVGQVTGFAPTQTPSVQVSVWVQALPSEQVFELSFVY
jgi:hypothetical protein